MGGGRERAEMKARPGDSTWSQTMALFVAVSESGKLRDCIITALLFELYFIESYIATINLKYYIQTAMRKERY